MASLAELDDVSRIYVRGGTRIEALSSFSLAIEAGEMVALVGPSGCGKSTCLNLFAGVDRPDRGSVRVLDLDLSHAPERELALLRRRRLGIVFQSFHLVPHLSVEENVMLPLALDRRRDPERVLALIERVGLTERRTHFPSELSGGEQQRTAIARALVHRPVLLLADEPTGNLDSRSGELVLELLEELRREQGAALLLATHDERVARRADRVVYMRDGHLDLGQGT